MTTLRDLYEWIRTAPVNDVGDHKLPGGDWSLQIYSTKHQVNVCKDGLSHLNIVFQGDDETVKAYRCERPGYCDYFHPKEFTMNCPINMLPATGDVIETIRDAMKGFHAAAANI